jgi:hypothetical protein
VSTRINHLIVFFTQYLPLQLYCLFVFAEADFYVEVAFSFGAGTMYRKYWAAPANMSFNHGDRFIEPGMIIFPLGDNG